jgi:hypothetical protein
VCRFTFSFQAIKTIKTIKAGDPVTDLGARVDFERNLPGTSLTVARLEVVALTTAQAQTAQIKLLLNPANVVANKDCTALAVAQNLCGAFLQMKGNNPMLWPTPMAALSGRELYTRDTSLLDPDGDGIADVQDICSGTPVSSPVNASGCAFSQWKSRHPSLA